MGEVIVTPETVKQSILELRKIYKEKSDAEFVKWYSRRYHIHPATIRKVLGIK